MKLIENVNDFNKVWWFLGADQFTTSKGYVCKNDWRLSRFENHVKLFDNERFVMSIYAVEYKYLDGHTLFMDMSGIESQNDLDQARQCYAELLNTASTA